MAEQAYTAERAEAERAPRVGLDDGPDRADIAAAQTAQGEELRAATEQGARGPGLLAQASDLSAELYRPGNPRSDHGDGCPCCMMPNGPAEVLGEEARQKAAEAFEGEESEDGEQSGDAEGGGGGQSDGAATGAAGHEAALFGLLDAPEGTATALLAAADVDLSALRPQLPTTAWTAQTELMAGTCVPGYPAGYPGVLGLTTYNVMSFGRPDAKIKVTHSTPGPTGQGPSAFIAQFETTTSKDATWPCVASPAGTKKVGTVQVPTKGGGQVAVDLYMEITAAIHGQIMHAEEEHLADLLLAYQLGLEKPAQAVNALAGQNFVAGDEAAAKTQAKKALADKLDPKLTADPMRWLAVTAALCALSGTRRDAKGTHTFVDDPATMKVDAANKKVTIGLKPGPNFKQFPATDIIKYANVP